MKKIKLLNRISNISLGIGVAIAIYYFANVFLTRQSLPAGACPYTTYREYAIISGVFLVLSLVMDIIKSTLAKKQKTEQ